MRANPPYFHHRAARQSVGRALEGSRDMNLEQPLRRALLGEQVKPGAWAIPLGAGRWHVLFAGERRPLLVPVAGWRFQDRSLSYFVPGGWKALYGRGLLLANSALPAAGLLPEFSLGEGVRGFLSDPAPLGQSAHTAIQIGAAGPHQKAAVVLLTERGEGHAIAKLAMVPGADRKITAEARWLVEFESVPELENQVPRLINEGAAPNGRRYLSMTLAPGTRSTKAFTAAHAAFLGALGRVSRDIMSFTASPCLEYLEQACGRLEPQLSRQERASLHSAVRDCRSRLAGWTGPFVTSHGDFAHWNICVQEDRIFVFDWEDAKAGANPLADAFNYFVMPRALRGGGTGPRFMAATMRRVEEIAQQLYPEWIWRARVVSALGLAYLLDAMFNCHARNRRLVRTHPVIGACLRAIEERSEWMAS
jgi:hypothetical protein